MTDRFTDWRALGEQYRQKAIDAGPNHNPAALALLAVYAELRHQEAGTDESTRAMQRLAAMLDQHGEMLAQTMRR